MNQLTTEVNINIRFGETDAMGVVWHGNYLKYFEDGREAFGLMHDLSYMEIYNSGYFTPIVKCEIDYKSPLHYGESARIKVKHVYSTSAKLIFEYEIFNITRNIVSATGTTIQIFLNSTTRELELNKPPFFKEWERKTGLK